MKAEISKYVSKALNHTPASGMAIVAGNSDSILYEGYFGSVHPSSSSQVSAKTLFDIQSITKVLATAPLLQHFLMIGRLRLGDRAAQFVSELAGGEKSKITVAHLFQHTSGYSDEEFSSDFENPIDGWNKMLRSPLRFMPGTAVEYSDVGYRILGRILEITGGATLDDLCTRFVWRPLGMLKTTYQPDKFPKEQIAGQGTSWGRVDDDQDHRLGGNLGCDGVFTTAQDIALYCQHVLKNKVFDQPFWSLCSGNEEGHKGHFNSLVFGKKIAGWEMHSGPNRYCDHQLASKVLEKAGGAGAFVTLLPNESRFMVYLTNHGRPDPFTETAWNEMIAELEVQNIFRTVETPYSILFTTLS